MSPAAQLPLVIPSDAYQAMGVEEFARRLAQVAILTAGASVLDLGNGGGSLVLARDYGCQILAAGPDEKRLAELKAHPQAEHVETRKLTPGELPFSEGEFDAVICLEQVLMPLEDAVVKLRPFLKESTGHLALLCPVAVGRHPPPEEWIQVFGFAPRLPHASFAVFEKNGFEPVTAETLSDLQLEAYYDAVAENLRHFPEKNQVVANRWRAELAAHAEQSGNARVTWACLIGRRREPFEKPMAARTAG